jgi:hypothetical protein
MRPDTWALRIGTTAAALSCVITSVARDPNVELGWFDVVVLLLAITPYVVAVAVSGWSDLLRVWSRVSVTLYGVLDVYIRAEATWFPDSSTAGIVMVTLPFTGMPVAFLISAGITAIFTEARAALVHRK